MAKNVFRITPRASQVMRAIEDTVQRQYDEASPEGPKVIIIFNYGDFRFSQEDGYTYADFDRVEMMSTLAPDRELFIAEDHFRGRVKLSPWRANDDILMYKTEAVELERIEPIEQAKAA